MKQAHKDNISKAMRGKMPKFIPNNKGAIRSDKNKKKTWKGNMKKEIILKTPRQ